MQGHQKHTVCYFCGGARVSVTVETHAHICLEMLQLQISQVIKQTGKSEQRITHNGGFWVHTEWNCSWC